jgi:peptidoglycan hydrolase CwlO-like protein
MKKYFYLLLVAGMLMTSCEFVNAPKQKKQLAAQNDSLITALQKKNVELENMLSIVSDIQTGFDKINEAEGRINIDDSGEMKVSDRAKMQEDMEFITKTLDNNRLKIAELEGKLKASGREVAGLKKLVNSLNNQLSDKTEQIVRLTSEIAEKNVQITELDDAVKTLSHNVKALTETKTAQEETIATQDAMINRAWYVYGTARELKEQKILKSGRVLSENDINLDYFTPIDIRSDVIFPLYAKRAELLTTHPEGSWYTEKDNEGKLTFVINDPTAFWSVSRYMVIKVR